MALAAGFGLVATALPTYAANSTGSEDKVSAAVQAELDSSGSADVWLHFGAKADLSAAYGMSWSDRGQYVYDALSSTAEASQESVRAQLDAAGADYESFYIVNAIKVSAADAALVRSVASSDTVDSVRPSFEVTQHDPVAQEPASATPQATEWGVDNVNAPAVWEQYGTGEGITVASIDTGVQYDHPTLVSQYRGNDGGSFDHNYNWFDPQYGGTDAPADGHGHGTHVTGTMVGDDGAGNQIGVAPGADWIATSGCCPSDAALLDSMEWVLAPTDLNGQNANPDMRPHIVNNSWGTELPSNDPFGEEWSEAWAAAGIFGIFANGNSGELGCESSGSPGSRPINYSVGAHDVNNVVGSFSGRGPGANGEIKPNISAPGVSVRSAFPDNAYATASGTSMAAPHVAGAVALLWSAAPNMVGNIEGTRALLDQTAIDTEDLSCGGTPENNNVYGEGRLDALALIEAALDDQPGDPVEITRYQGENRYETAADIAARYDGADTVYVTTGTAFYDSLSVSPAAARGVMGTMATPDGQPAPILLTKPGQLPATTRAILDEIAPSNIVILGRDAAVSPEIEEELGAYAENVSRIGGEDRYETSVNIARQFQDPEVVYVALGMADYYADALAGSALAGTQSAPIVLTKTDSVPQVTLDYLAEVPNAQVIVLGGESVVSQEVYEQVGAEARYGAEDRYRTSLVISEQFESADQVFVATGKDYADALAGGALAGSVNAPVILVPGDNSSLGGMRDAFDAELDRLSPSSIVILGGPAAVTQEIEDDIAAIANN